LTVLVPPHRPMVAVEEAQGAALSGGLERGVELQQEGP
jgi:hypothetical protein